MITTERGDKGKSYWANKVVDKDSPLLEAVGTIDELQSNLGVVRALLKDEQIKEEILDIQKDMYGISGELACDMPWKGKDRVNFLTNRVKEVEESLPPLKEFLIPGENSVEAQVNVCRTVARRTERRVVSLNKECELNEEILKYFNRLSDYLFIISRTIK